MQRRRRVINLIRNAGVGYPERQDRQKGIHYVLITHMKGIQIQSNNHITLTLSFNISSMISLSSPIKICQRYTVRLQIISFLKYNSITFLCKKIARKETKKQMVLCLKNPGGCLNNFTCSIVSAWWVILGMSYALKWPLIINLDRFNQKKHRVELLQTFMNTIYTKYT